MFWPKSLVSRETSEKITLNSCGIWKSDAVIGIPELFSSTIAEELDKNSTKKSVAMEKTDIFIPL